MYPPFENSTTRIAIDLHIYPETPQARLGYYRVWQYGLSSFQTGGIKLERFLPKNQHTQRKFLNFENWTNGEHQ